MEIYDGICHEGGEGLECHIPILKNDFFKKNIQNHSLIVKTCFALSLGYVCIVVEMTLNMAK